MRRLVRLALLPIFLTIFASPTSTALEPERTISVMTRNIYLGADVGVALNLLPDFPAAAQFMWDQMRATDFQQRSRKLAQEFATLKLDVIGIQEATKWICKKGLLSRKQTIFDFLEILLDETKKTGVGYSLISKDGDQTYNRGFSIPAIPKLTIVEDQETFEPIFGQSSAACGFEIADALLIRDGLDAQVLQLGNSEFKTYYTVVPVVMDIYRGYTWADLKIEGKRIRVVTTHLESLFDESGAPHSSIQAEQLIEDLASTKSPLIVMGDFNADPRDPRGPDAPNPGGQPASNVQCEPQSKDPTRFDASCNAYWKMIQAGYIDLGPDSLSLKNLTWGATALLDGPDEKRVRAAEEMGNEYGFTDRLDYIFVRNGLNKTNSKLVSFTWPKGEANWDCRRGGQERSCLPSDHVGIFATIGFSDIKDAVADEALPDHRTLPWLKLAAAVGGILLILVLIWLPYRLLLQPLIIGPLQRRRAIRN